MRCEVKINSISLCVIIMITVFQPVAANVITVGEDPQCDVQTHMGGTLQQAINTAGVTEVRVVKDVVADPVTINQPLVLSGGFDDCSLAAQGTLSTSPDLNATIDGNQLSRVITINSNTSGLVELRYLNVVNGAAGTTDPATQSGGGIYAPASNQADVNLVSSEVSQNEAFGGGGIYFDGNSHNTHLTLINSQIINNTANNTTTSGFNGGGGVFVTGGQLSLLEDNYIFGNTATSTSTFAIAGGIFINNALAHFVSGPGIQNNGIISNEAMLRGGGVYLGGGVDLRVYGHPIELNGVMEGHDLPFVFQSNQALSDSGGGLFSIDSNVTLEHVDFVENQANTAGGGVYSTNSSLNIDSPSPDMCWRDQGCNRFMRNQATFGGVFYVINGGNADVKQSYFNDNSADAGTVLNVRFASAQMESVVIYREAVTNTGLSNNDVIANDQSHFTMKYATVVENRTTAILSMNAFSPVETNEVYNSIIYNPLADNLGVTSNSGTNVYDCVISDTIEANISIINSEYANLLVNPAAQDFRLQPNSVAVDVCDGTGTATPNGLDLDGLERGYDQPNEFNVFGPFDAGANELNTDLIFADDFE